MGRPYYSKIARQWHEATGNHGGPFKRHVLNEHLLGRIEGVEGRSILELGAGNGYFLPLLLRRRSGQSAARIVVSDQSGEMLQIAQDSFRIDGAEYARLDVRTIFPFEEDAFDLVVATMVFNELSDAGLRAALHECGRVLAPGGQLLATVTHPRFVENLAEDGQLRRLGHESWTMPGTGSMRLPVVPRQADEYEELLTAAGFTFQSDSLHPTREVLHERAGLRHSRGLPLALVFDCRRSDAAEPSGQQGEESRS